MNRHSIKRALPTAAVRAAAVRAAALAACLGAAGCLHAPGSAPAPRAAVDSSPEALIERAASFSAAGDHLRAEQYLSAALAQGADERRVLPLLLEQCIADQRYRDALQHVEAYVRRHPADPAARFLLASLLLALGHTEQALQALEAVLAAAPRHAEAHYALAVLLRDSVGDAEAADRHFREYLRLRPRGPHVEEARGSLLASLPQPLREGRP